MKPPIVTIRTCLASGQDLGGHDQFCACALCVCVQCTENRSSLADAQQNMNLPIVSTRLCWSSTSLGSRIWNRTNGSMNQNQFTSGRVFRSHAFSSRMLASTDLKESFKMYRYHTEIYVDIEIERISNSTHGSADWNTEKRRNAELWSSHPRLRRNRFFEKQNLKSQARGNVLETLLQRSITVKMQAMLRRWWRQDIVMRKADDIRTERECGVYFEDKNIDAKVILMWWYSGRCWHHDCGLSVQRSDDVRTLRSLRAWWFRKQITVITVITVLTVITVITAISMMWWRWLL